MLMQYIARYARYAGILHSNTSNCHRLIMSDSSNATHDFCWGCVYYPPNLPRNAYSDSDWSLLQSRTCSFDHLPNSPDCLATRKTSCSLIDLASTLPKP